MHRLHANLTPSSMSLEHPWILVSAGVPGSNLPDTKGALYWSLVYFWCKTDFVHLKGKFWVRLRI